MSNNAEMRALVLTHDAGMVGVFTGLFHELGVVTENCGDELKAAKALSRSKVEALVLDFDNMPASFLMIKTLREGRSNKSAVILAVATDSGMKQRALDQGTNFVFERPFDLPQMKEALQTAYGLMLRDRKQYFRLAIELEVSIQTSSGMKLRGTIINISRNGMAVFTPSPINTGESLEIGFDIAEADLSVSAEGTVVWDDRHGKAGICFQCASPNVQNRFQGWLDDEFYAQFDIGNRARYISHPEHG